MTNQLKNKRLFFLGFIVFSLMGCQKTNIRDRALEMASPIPAIAKKTESSKGLFDIMDGFFGDSPYHDSANDCWLPLKGDPVFILAMGANTGKGKNKLKETAYDAENFAQAMQGLFQVDKSQVCLLRDVSKSEFRRALKRLEKMVNADDLVIIYYSGHGYQWYDDNKDEKDGLDEFFVTYSKSKKIDENGIEGFMIRDDEFSKLIAAIDNKTPHILTVMDVCFSEGLDKGKGSTERIKALKGKRLKKRKVPSHIGATLDPIRGVLLSATKEGQKAVELGEQCHKTGKYEKGVKGGRFTFFFLQALKRAKQKSVKVNLLKVFDETRDSVLEHSRQCSEKAQEPVIKGKDKLFQRINRYIP